MMTTHEVEIDKLSQQDKNGIIRRVLKGKTAMASILFMYGDHWKNERRKTCHEASSKLQSFFLRGGGEE